GRTGESGVVPPQFVRCPASYHHCRCAPEELKLAEGDGCLVFLYKVFTVLHQDTPNGEHDGGPIPPAAKTVCITDPCWTSRCSCAAVSFYRSRLENLPAINRCVRVIPHVLG